MQRLRLTDYEKLILKAVNTRPGWLNCSGVYIGEVLALQVKGAIESRVINNQLQVRAKEVTCSND